MGRWVRREPFEQLHNLDLKEAKDGLTHDLKELGELFCSNCILQFRGDHELILRVHVSVARLIGKSLQAIFESIEVFHEDLQAYYFEPAASDLVISGACLA